MCSVMGYCSDLPLPEQFDACFAETVSRGPDMDRVIDTGKGVLAFHRLSIMGLTEEGMQPFLRDGSAVVCNGELYGFAEMKRALEEKGYAFQSDSDCEILLPLYFEYGTEMFSMLDAEFALILFDGRTQEFLAARDPIGIRPLYYGYDARGVIVFASEPKNLVGLCKEILPFPPGHYWKNGRFFPYCDIAAVDTVVHDDLDAACGHIREKLTAGVKKRLVADAKVGFLLSGGLDSSLVCAIA
ncbi:MAG: asparagine synthetase B, partial [Clostridia bacterium]|nr:asparagine synthetase B [Clostridia bacterium]